LGWFRFAFMLALSLSNLRGAYAGMTKTTERLEQLRKQEAQLKARIQQERAKLNATARKEGVGKDSCKKHTDR